MEKLTFTIHNGKVTVEASGFTGTGCKAATAAFERALGEVEERRSKPELFQAATEGGAACNASS